MRITNGLVYTPDGTFIKADLLVREGQVAEILPDPAPAESGAPGEEWVDAEEGYILPGLVDIHFHGALGYDFSDADPQGIQTMLQYCAGAGVTALVGATVSLPLPQLSAALKAARPFLEVEGQGAILHGMRAEGPFLSSEKKGAQNPSFLSQPQQDAFREMMDASGGKLRLIDIAPELPESLDFISTASRSCRVSLAHTAANYRQSSDAFSAGASHVAHLFNAMPLFHHRAPGLVGAASDYAQFVELIADGVHLHPSVVRAIFKWFGRERVCLVSDSIRATGLPTEEGQGRESSLGGLKVVLDGNKASLPDGTIAGSILNLAECCRCAADFGVPLEEVLRAATLNPARAAGLDGILGSLVPGKRADILIWDRDLNTRQVYIGGRFSPPGPA